MASIDHMHKELPLKKGEHFLREAERSKRIGMVEQGVLRGYVVDDEGEEITTHFYQEGDMLFGNFIPNVPSSTSIQALSDCIISMASFQEVMSLVNKDERITEVVNRSFHKLNAQMRSRLISLANLRSVQKYALLLEEYPNLINRVPHYYVASFLGITPTQLSRARKEFSQQM